MRLNYYVVALAAGVSFISSGLAGVNGMILDGAGKPVAHADVFLYYAQSESAANNRLVEKVTSGDDGKFVFVHGLEWEKGAPAGQIPPRFSVIANKTDVGLGYANLLAGDGEDGVNISIASRSTARLTVVHTNGKPMSQAHVWLMAAVPKNPGASALTQALFVTSDIGLDAVTDDKGQAEMLVPPGMRYIFAASKDGYARSFGDKQIVLVPGATVKGTVIGADGKPLPNARVTLTSQLLRGFDNFASATTDDRGRYEIRDIPATGYRVEMDGQKMEGAVRDSVVVEDPAHNMAAASDAFDPQSGETVTVNLEMTKQNVLEVSGKVVDADTALPLTGIMLSSYSSDRKGNGQQKMLTTDAQGNFRLNAKPGSSVNVYCQDASDGSYLLDETSSGISRQFYARSLKQDKRDIVLKLKLRKLAPLSGSVVDADGKGVAGVLLYMDNRLPPVTTSPDGSFNIKNAPTDRDGAIVAANQNMGGKADFKAGQSQVTIKVLAKRPRQLVAVNDEGTPAADLYFNYAPVAGTSAAGTLLSLSAPAQADAQGKCTLNLIPDVTYRFSWSGESDKNRDYSDDSALVVAGDRTADPIQFVARQYLNALFVKVQNTKGEPIPDARLQVSDWDVISADQQNQMYNLKTDKDGMVQFNRLAKGLLQFQVYSAGNYRNSRFAIPTEEAEAICVLRGSSEADEHTIYVRTSDGQAIPNARLTLLIQKGGAIREESYTADQAGVFKVPTFDRSASVAVYYEDPEQGWGAVQLNSYEGGAVVLRLHKPGIPLQLQFVDAQKKPVVGAKVRISSLASNPPGARNVSMQSLPSMQAGGQLERLGLQQVTDNDGRVSFPKVDARLMGSLMVETKEFGAQSKELPASGGTSIIELVKLARIHGKLSAKGIDHPDFGGIMIYLQSDHSRWGHGLQQDGSFDFDQVQPGQCTLVVGAPRQTTMKTYRAPSIALKLAPGEDKAVEVQLDQGIPIRGKFLAMVNGKRPKIALREDEFGGFTPVELKPDGGFEFWVGEPGEYELYYESQENSYSTWPETITVKDRNPLEGLEFKQQ